MKIWKWNVGFKGIIVGGLGLLAAAIIGKISEDAVGGAITKVDPEETKEETNQEDSNEDSTEETDPDEKTSETEDEGIEITEF